MSEQWSTQAKEPERIIRAKKDNRTPDLAFKAAYDSLNLEVPTVEFRRLELMRENLGFSYEKYQQASDPEKCLWARVVVEEAERVKSALKGKLSAPNIPKESKDEPQAQQFLVELTPSTQQRDQRAMPHCVECGEKGDLEVYKVLGEHLDIAKASTPRQPGQGSDDTQDIHANPEHSVGA